MTVLCIFPENDPRAGEVIDDPGTIADRMRELGALFERWELTDDLPPDADQPSILEAYRGSVRRLQQLFGFQSADVIGVHPDHPQKAELRAKFLDEHTHSDFEVRFFVQGRGLFYLHPGDQVYALLCERGDLISVPAGLKHWFDLGGEPHLQCIRLFTTPDGWVANYTGDTIGQRFPTLESFREQFA
ncbi:MAG: cupin [Methylococcaceae bacterium]|nr:cupin [Methylococcaceae bacterium]